MNQKHGDGGARRWMGAGLLALAALGAGCQDQGEPLVSGGGNSGGGGGGGGNAAADLGSADGIKTQVGTFATLVSALGTLEALNRPPAAARSGVPGKASEACQDGGSREDFSTPGKAVNSPFTSQTFDVNGERTLDCTLVSESSGGGSSSRFELVLNGSAESGQVSDNGEVLYIGVGDSPAAPYRFDYAFSSSGSGNGFSFSSEIDLDFGIYYRVDSRRDNAGAESRYHLDFGGDYQAVATSNGQTGRGEGRFESFLGSAEAPFVITSDASQGLTLDGRYGFSISPAPQGARCTDAEVSVSTLSPLFRSTTSNGSPYEAGRLEFRSGEDRATVEFNSDGTVTVTPAGGTPSTLRFAEAQSAAAPCAGFAFAGFAFAAGAGL